MRVTGCTQVRKDKLASQAYQEAEERRIAAQRNLFTFLMPSAAKELLLQGMLKRAEDLFYAGKSKECDAILEFVPSADADRLLNSLLDEIMK